MLLVVNTNDNQLAFVDDNTVEGAVVLMEKIGFKLDTKLTQIKTKISENTAKPPEIETASKIDKTFDRF